jgi:hypothetical protein
VEPLGVAVYLGEAGGAEGVEILGERAGETSPAWGIGRAVGVAAGRLGG